MQPEGHYHATSVGGDKTLYQQIAVGGDKSHYQQIPARVQIVTPRAHPISVGGRPISAHSAASSDSGHYHPVGEGHYHPVGAESTHYHAVGYCQVHGRIILGECQVS